MFFHKNIPEKYLKYKYKLNKSAVNIKNEELNQIKFELLVFERRNE